MFWSSFAVVLWEVLSRQIPFDGEEYKFNAQVKEAVIEGVRPVIAEGTSPALKNLISQCWHDNPSRRPTFSEIVPTLKDVVVESRLSHDLSYDSSNSWNEFTDMVIL